jgi:hypothetical protein
MHVEQLDLSVKKMKPKSIGHVEPEHPAGHRFALWRRTVAWRFAPMLASGTSGTAEAPP